jgi:hypothetical protein
MMGCLVSKEEKGPGLIDLEVKNSIDLVVNAYQGDSFKIKVQGT